MADSIKVQGWCPSAWKPMRAHDGWIVRVRPLCASITAAQWRTLAELALTYAHPQIELTRLGNVQLRGVSEEQLPLLRSQLIAARLVPADEDADLAPAVHCTAFYRLNDQTHELAQSMCAAAVARLSPRALQSLGLPALPSKFGLLVDDGERNLRSITSDLRLWVSADGTYRLALGDDGDCYRFNTVQQAVEAAVQVAIWFAQERMTLAGKSSTRLKDLLLSRQPEVPALKQAAFHSTQPGTALPILPGRCAQGWVLGAPLGRIDATAMQKLAAALPASTEIRITPWRSLLLIAADAQSLIAQLDEEHWIKQPADARLKVSACTGSPRCAQAHIPAQDMALRFAPHISEGRHLHVSGCAKFCALSSDATSAIFASTDTSGAVLLNACSAKQLGQPVFQVPYQAWLAAPAELQQHLHDLPI